MIVTVCIYHTSITTYKPGPQIPLFVFTATNACPWFVLNKPGIIGPNKGQMSPDSLINKETQSQLVPLLFHNDTAKLIYQGECR